MEGRAEVTDVGVLRLGSYVLGEPERGEVVVVPGLCVSAYLRPTSDAMAALGYRVHLVDPPWWPSSGPPARPPARLADLADPLVRWLGLRGLDDVTVVGQSVGAQLAAHVAGAARGRVRSLVLQGPTFDPRNATMLRAAARLALDFPRERLSLLPIQAPEWLRVGLRQVRVVARLALADRLEDSLALVPVPVLVAVGEHDPLVTRTWTKSLATSARGPAEHVVMPGLPHSSPHADPVAFADLVSAFDRRVGSSAGRGSGD